MAKKILLLAANPKDTTRLRLDEELRDIEAAFQRSRRRNQIKLKKESAVGVGEMRRALLDFRPNIVHFSGHGSGEPGIYLEDAVGKAHAVTADALADFFKLFADTVECVVLNACYSAEQAEAIARHIPYVIGMTSQIGDRAALAFSVAFYDAIGTGEPIPFAHQLGCNAIQLAGIREETIPILINQMTSRTPSPSSATQIRPVEASPQALIPGCAYDIFVSYAPEDEDAQRWVSAAISDLKKLLDVSFSRRQQSPRWVEHSACTSKALNDLQQSATMLVFFSRHYLASDWCQASGDFFSALQQAIRRGLKVFLMELDVVERPPIFGSIIGHQFWIADAEGRFLRRTAFDRNAEDDLQRYQSQLWQLSSDLAKEIQRQIKRAAIRQEIEQAGVLIDRDDVDKALANRVAQKLGGFGVEYVFPYIASGKTPSDAKNEFEEAVSGCEGILMVYGAASGDWLVREVNRMRVIFVKQGKTPPKAYAIYDGPPEENPLPEPFRFPGIIMNCRDCRTLETACQACSNEHHFSEFVQRLKDDMKSKV